MATSFSLGRHATRYAAYAAPRRRVVINGDDFGLSSAVNQAIALGYRNGVLRSTSLMVGERSVAEAVEIIRTCPGLAVGLHVVLSDGYPVLPPEQIPCLVQANGRFWNDETKLFRSIIISRAVRSQIYAEIAAQFAVFRATGLICDHVNTHRNSHRHPIIAAMLFRMAKQEGVGVVRIPWCPQKTASMYRCTIRYTRAVILRRLAKFYGLVAADRAIGLSGQDAFLAQLNALPYGTTEIYLHPATANTFPGSVINYPYQDDLAALLDIRAIQLVKASPANFMIGGYRNMLT